MTLRDAESEAILVRLLEEHNLVGEKRLYREAMRQALTATATPGVYRLAANPSASESVIDVYGPGYVVQADRVGPGLAFAESPSRNWQETMELRALRAEDASLRAAAEDRVEVAVRLQDLLQQGGLVYPVESVTVERGRYFTLPQGSVEVREATQ
jgi:hypothetical protein